MKIQKSFLTKILFLLASFSFLGAYFLIQSGRAMELTWDDREKGAGLHVYSTEKDKRDKEWSIREVGLGDTQFYQKLLSDADFVKKIFGSDKPIAAEVAAGMVENWVEKFAQGTPFSQMTIEQDNEAVGSICIRTAKDEGIGEIGLGFKPSTQGNGLGTEAHRFIVEKWAPKVRQIGCGQDTNAPIAAINKFTFNGEPLKKLYAGASISNPASWQIYKHFDFHPSQPTNNNYQISCEACEESQDGPLEQYIMNKYFSSTSPQRLQHDVFYEMLDERGIRRTLSFSSKYQMLQYHFECDVK